MATHNSEVSYADTGLGTISSGSTAHVGAVRYRDIGNGSVSAIPSEGAFRVVVVQSDGTPIANIENAAPNSGVTFPLNSWEEWSFELPVTDSKASYILSQKFREAQLWWGDTLLSWGPMSRPQVANGLITVTVSGALWYLSRRYVGKANRDNMLANPSFESGLSGWTFLRTAWFLDFQPIPSGQVRIYGPGRGGKGNALELNSRLRPYTPPPGAITNGNITTHTVTSGQTLWGLALWYYGAGPHWVKIYEANKAQIQWVAAAAGLWNPKDPGHWIFPGMDLVIPGLRTSEVQPVPEDNGLRWGDTIGFQDFVVYGGVRGATLTLTGWIKIPSQYLEDWGGGVGLLLARLPQNYRTDNFWSQTGRPNTWGGRRALYTNTIEWQASRLMDGHPLNGWIRHEVSITVPPGRTEVVQARVNGVSGKVYWDQLTLTRDTAFEQHDVDQATIIRNLTTHAQDPTYQKSSVNITTNTPATRVRRDLVALHSEHANVWDLMVELTEMEEGLDIGMRYTPTSRILTTHFPFRGRTRTNLHLRLGRNISTYDWAFDGEAAASSTIVLGTGSGSDREEAAFVRPTAFANGLILETVTAAGPEVPVDRLQERANELGAVNLNPETISVTTYPHSPDDPERRFIGGIEVGDLIPVTILDGPMYSNTGDLTGWALEVDDIYRIVAYTINPDGTLNINLNRRDFGNAL